MSVYCFEREEGFQLAEVHIDGEGREMSGTTASGLKYRTGLGGGYSWEEGKRLEGHTMQHGAAA